MKENVPLCARITTIPSGRTTEKNGNEVFCLRNTKQFTGEDFLMPTRDPITRLPEPTP